MGDRPVILRFNLKLIATKAFLTVTGTDKYISKVLRNPIRGK